jgi:lipid-A-disaccharide synthase
MARRVAEPPLVLVLPGSRSGEIARHLAIFGAAIARIAERCGRLELVLPTLPHLADRVMQATVSWPVRPRIIVAEAEKRAAFRTARAALAASGTVTLELALAGVPTVVAYRVGLLNELIYRSFVRVPTIVLANLVLGENVMPEIVQRDATPERLAATLAPLLADTRERYKQLDAFRRIDAAMALGNNPPSEAAAEIVLDIAKKGRAPDHVMAGKSAPRAR